MYICACVHILWLCEIYVYVYFTYMHMYMHECVALHVRIQLYCFIANFGFREQYWRIWSAQLLRFGFSKVAFHSAHFIESATTTSSRKRHFGNTGHNTVRHSSYSIWLLYWIHYFTIFIFAIQHDQQLRKTPRIFSPVQNIGSIEFVT